jgi:hypothetical protein
MFIDFVCFNCGVHDIQEITRGMARNSFRSWYLNKVGAETEREVNVAM